MLTNILYITIGASLGASFRYAIQVMSEKIITSPTSQILATLSANTIGCLAAGILLAYSEKNGLISQELKLLISVGFISSFTTFSALINQSFKLINNGQIITTIAYIITSLTLGFILFFMGYAMVKWGG